MILAEKIVKLRKQAGWSQEELAEKMNVSRQSVSKWEGTNSIPDLNKIIRLADLFDVSTDYLLKENVESLGSFSDDSQNNRVQVSLEQALTYVENKMAAAKLIARGVFLCVSSVLPLFALLALAKSNQFNLTSNIATPVGIVLILVMIAVGVSFFIRTNHYESDLGTIENGPFELAYGVHGIFKEKLQKFRGTYNLRVTVSIALFIFSFVPLIFSNVLYRGSDMILLMLMVMILMIASGVYMLVPVSTKYEAFNRILIEGNKENIKSNRTKRAEKLAAFYWPFLVAIYLGWSLWTMDWKITWILFPVGAVLFAALVGLVELLNKDDT